MNKIISAVVEIDGKIIHFGSGEIEVPVMPAIVDPDLYAADGFSNETVLGCVRNYAVDVFLAGLAAGDVYQRQVAASAAVWFATFVDGRDYDDGTRKLLIRNYQQGNSGRTFISGWIGSMMFESFYPKVVRDMTDTRPPFTYYYGEAMKGATTPIYGFSPFEPHKTLAEAYITKLERKVIAVRFHAENPNTPKVSPGL